jgi:Uncharacterized small membrane protein
MNRYALPLAFFLAASSVLLGALGTHALKAVLTSELLVSFETGVRYQFYHALAMIFTAILAEVFKRNLTIVQWFFSLGILFFSGSIYLLTYFKNTGIVGLKGLGLLTPVGGVCFIVGWLVLCIQFSKKI